MSSYYSKYLSTYIKKTFEDLLETDNLTNIILYSNKTSGKTLTAHYISYRYYEKLFEKYKIDIDNFKQFKCFNDDLKGLYEYETKDDYKKVDINQDNLKLNISDFYLYLSLSLYPNSVIIKKITDYIKNQSKESYFKKMYDIREFKKIIILDDIYFVNKLTTDCLIKLLSSYNTSKVVFILIVKELSDLHPLIISRCLTFYSKPFEAKPEYLLAKYPELTETTVKTINKFFNNMSTDGLNNSLCLVETFIQYVDKYKFNNDLNICLITMLQNDFIEYVDKYKINDLNDSIITMLQNDIIHDNKISFIKELLKLCIYSTETKDEINIKVVKLIKKIYSVGIYSDQILNTTLSYIINSDVSDLTDDIKIVFIKELTKSLFLINKYSESFFQVNKCFIKIVNKLH